MKRDELNYIKQLDFNINTLRADVEILKGFKDKDSKAILKDKDKMLKRLQQQLEDFKENIKREQAEYMAEQRAQQQKLTKEKLDIFYKYMAHIGTLDNPDKVDVKLREEFLNIKNFGPIRVALRKLMRM